jgi:hypothetical protein
MTERLRVVSVQRLLAMAAGRRFAVVDGVGVIDEGTSGFGVETDPADCRERCREEQVFL